MQSVEQCPIRQIGVLIVLGATFLRLLVGLHGHSGAVYFSIFTTKVSHRHREWRWELLYFSSIHLLLSEKYLDHVYVLQLVTRGNFRKQHNLHRIASAGESTPPKYGDYEAQRHWMEITLNAPIREWYIDTPSNPLEYWGIDYPPLSAYQSYVSGLMLQAIEPAATQLNSSRGYESPTSKQAMRLTVILFDLIGVLLTLILLVDTLPWSCCSHLVPQPRGGPLFMKPGLYIKISFNMLGKHSRFKQPFAACVSVISCL
jgi:hypothetical protein